MDRRSFLLAMSGMLAATPRAIAGMTDMENMPGMSGMHMNHKQIESRGPVPTLPEGAPLRELPRIENKANQPSYLLASLIAQPATARIAEHVDTPILTYNELSPGPLIEATEGDHVWIEFKNLIPGEPSTVHWHGVSVPADMDGNPTDAVASGFDRVYSFDIPPASAGSYWYHPHPHGLTASQVYRGLAGPFVVKPKVDPIPAAYGDTVLFFTDLRLGADGAIPANTMVDLMNGRVGDHVLVNGQKNPVLSIRAGAARRFRLYNATNARFLRLSFGDTPMTIIGSDGGLLETAVAGVHDVLLAPAERLEIVVAFEHPGTVALQTLDYDRGWMGPSRPRSGGITIMRVQVSSERMEPPPQLPAALRSIAALGAPTLTRRFVFGEAMSTGAKGMTMGFMINGVSFDMNRIDVVSKVGAVELWEIVNPTDMDHPFHVHGAQFQIVNTERAGKVSAPLYKAWKDTVNVARGETVRLALRQDFPGLRVYHCHILEHEDLGMMGMLDVRA
jgi:FtsP/CotA-like multicopper oxidase with cupredoxin domain